MKKLAILMTTLFMVSLLSACATTGSGDKMMVKCPACGHQFEHDPNFGQ